jgi:AraC-like DNA-binding protein
LLNKLPSDTKYYIKNFISVERSRAQLEFSAESYSNSLKILKNVHKMIDKTGHIQDTLFHREILFEKTYVYNSIGNNYLFLDMKNKVNLDSAFVYFKKAYLNSKVIDSTNVNFLDDYYARASRVALKKGNFEEAINYSNLQGELSTDSDASLGNTYIKARAFANLEQWDSVVFYGSYYYNITKEEPNINQKQIALYNDLAIAYYNLKELDSSYKYSNLTLSRTDKLNKQIKSTLGKIHSSNIDSYRKLNQKIRTEKNRNKDLFWFAGLSFVIVVVLLSFHFINRQQINKRAYLNLLKDFNETIAGTSIKENQVAKSTITDELSQKLLLGFNKIESSGVFLNTNFNIKIASKILNSNTTYVSRFVNDYYGISFNKYLSQLRMKSFASKLSEDKEFGKFTIEAMGREVGYKNASSFSRAFKRHFKMSPSQYINK